LFSGLENFVSLEVWLDGQAGGESFSTSADGIRVTASVRGRCCATPAFPLCGAGSPLARVRQVLGMPVEEQQGRSEFLRLHVV